jgi:hypothetical protein
MRNREVRIYLDEKLKRVLDRKEVWRMKKVILAALGLLLMAGAAFAQAPDTAYVGLFTDVDRNTWTASHTGAPTDFMMYIYWLPSVEGFIGAEFKVTFPTNVLRGTLTTNPRITISLGQLTTGLAVVLDPTDCQPPGQWIETHNLECLLLSATPGVIQIAASGMSGNYQVSICDVNYTVRPVKRFTNICLNSSCTTATEKKTWGAIKSLF